MSQHNESIAIIGTGCRFPGDSNSPSKLWELLCKPRDLLTKIPSDRFDAEAFYHSDPEHHGTTDVKESYFLSDDPHRFDAQFFGIQPKEADSIDPQQRMLMETVYESLCAAGQTIEALQGSSTSVYVGLMCDDWSGMLGRDWDNFPTYTATGISRSIMSNRVSYFFDWHGPSMTIDTACSSSLVAVHQAVQTLRSGDSRVAVAAGANLILSPGMYIAESKLHMLSPTGRSRMWDADADGYARGEGFASVVLKTLSAALEDGDHIECIIRETGVNQDGRTTGITMPSNSAQTTLIRETYVKAGLDLDNAENWPQFFHAHGTGTQAGDPQESEAISKAFASSRSAPDQKLYVGSIKTIIGHTEGTAGLASLIGSSLAVQNGLIPPNMHFNKLSEKVAPFYNGLEIPTQLKPWPDVPLGQPRRASVNSFGFGGTNAHAIIESYDNAEKKISDAPLCIPLTFSAASERSLRALLVSYSEYLKSARGIRLPDLAWTLQSRRSALPFKATVSGSTAPALSSGIDFQLAQSEEEKSSIGIRSSNLSEPRVLGIFTGQGAQWAGMGRELIRHSPFVREKLAALDRSLEELPEDDRPSWSISAVLRDDTSSFDFGNASLAQPLCTAIQVVLVDLLRSTSIKLKAVVGHSSGEIGAAYAAGFLSAHDAIRIAYYRGLHAKLARSPMGKKGAMMAVGTSLEDARDFCDLDEFQGRLTLAASNSLASITLSGDEDAVDEATQIFNDEHKFARKLKVDTAYHSFHMEPCSASYLKSIDLCDIKVADGADCTWFSSVSPGQKMAKTKLTNGYWVDNMTNPVMFSNAVASAISATGSFDVTIEIGPHPALKGPCLNVIEETSGAAGTPYTGLLSRGKNDLEAISAAMGYTWTHTGAMDLDSFDRALLGKSEPKQLVTDLPIYPWDHQRSYWSDSRISGSYRVRKSGPHPLLGVKCTESATPQEIQWRNLLRQKEIPWLDGHKLQGQIVFPASGYAVMAIEAAMSLVGVREVQLVEVENLTIDRAIAFNDNTSAVETLLSLKMVTFGHISGKDEPLVADFKGYSCPDGEQSMALNASGRVILLFGAIKEDSLPVPQSSSTNMVTVDVERFYTCLGRLGYNYTHPFRGISSLIRRVDSAMGTLVDPPAMSWEDKMLIHPGMLDTAFQTIFAAYSSPGDNRLWSLHVPTSIKRITINPYHRAPTCDGSTIMPFQSAMLKDTGGSINADVDIFSHDGKYSYIQIEDVKLIPFSRPSPENDSVLFSKFVWDVAVTDGELAARNERPNTYEQAIAHDLERVCFFYLRRLTEVITPEEKANTLEHYQHLLKWASHVLMRVEAGDHPYLHRDLRHDSHDAIMELIDRYPGRVDVKLIKIVGENLPTVVRDRSNILEYMTQDGVLADFYEQGLGLTASNRWTGRMVRQMAHRYPHMNVFEIGAGTGGATKSILEELGSAFTSYTYTDISSAFFETARSRFEKYAARMVFKTFDIEKAVTAQGYVESSYDLIVASNVLHATKDLEDTMRNTRRLLKPGGSLLLLEVTNGEALRNGLPMGGLTGWWVGADSGRPWGPTLSLQQWDSLLRKTGFSGIDTTTPDYDTLTYPFSVFTTQAVDARVNFLRQPLSSSPEANVPKMEHLVIIGGKSPKTSKIRKEVIDCLAQCYKSKIVIDSVEAVERTEIPPASSVLSLAELDDPIFSSFTEARHNSLKTIFTQAKDMLWITSGCRAENPYSNMMVGVGRAVRFEYPHISLQMLDLDNLDAEAPKTIAASLLRLQAANIWTTDNSQNNLLYTSEPEMSLVEGRFIIPRLLPNNDQNQRYNSSRRLITHDVNPQESAVEIIAGASFELRDASNHKPWQEPRMKEMVSINVSHSLLQSVKIGSSGYLCLCLGRLSDSGQQVLALSEANQSKVQVPEALTILIDCTVDHSRILLSVASNLFARYVTSMVAKGSTLVVHEPDDSLIPVLAQHATDNGINLFCTTTVPTRSGSMWIFIHPKLTNRLIKRALPTHVSLFVDLNVDNRANDLGNRIARCLPSRCVPRDTTSFFDIRPMSHPGSSLADIQSLFQRVWADAKSSNFAMVETSATTLSLAKVPETEIGGPISIVDWMSTLGVPVKIHSVDYEHLFRPDRTYLLVGLSGEVGRSLCQWMIEHGARYVVLSSRNPKVSQDWIESLSAWDATVKPMSMDITSRESLRTAYREICRTLPPVAGVANGAMILKDRTFQKMDLVTMLDVLRPKVDGSKYLDELFSENTLDFFVLFSSMSSVVGNSGQSNYIAANMYMTSLAFQRKKRGLAGSVIDVSSLVGIGYVEHSEAVDADYFTKIGYTNISEQDLHQMFAEAMLAGRPESLESPEIVTGLAPAYADAEIKAPYRSDLKFCHFTIERPGEEQVAGQIQSIPVKGQLAVAKTKDQALDIMKDSFAARLRQILQVNAEDDLSETLSLVEQGVDSLVAVEVRSWFLKELGIDIPVLKILGGASMLSILEEALEGLSSNLTPAIKSAAEETVAVPATASLTTKVNVSGSTFARNIESSDRFDSLPIHLTNADEESQATQPTFHNDPIQTHSISSTPTSSSEQQDHRSRSNTPLSSSDSDTSSKHLKEDEGNETVERMSFGQSRFWFLNRFLLDKTTFNMAFSARLEGHLRLVDLEKAVLAVGQKHEALRTRFFSNGELMDQPMQGVHETSVVRLKHKLIGSESQATQELQHMRDHTWNLNTWESLKISVLSLSDTTSYLLVACHHIAMDGVSFQILISDLDKAYNGQKLSDCPPSSQYRAFAAEQLQEYENGKMQADIDFYRQTIPKNPQPITLLPFTRSKARGTLESYSSHRVDFRLDPVLADRLRVQARKNKATTFHFYLAALQCLVFRLLEDTDDFFIGITDANRTNSKYLGTLGFFLNLLPIHFHRNLDQSFSTAIRGTRDKSYSALAHSKLPFDVLLNELNISRSTTHSPLFQILVDYRQGVQEKSTFAGCKAEGSYWHVAKTPYDMGLDIIDNAAGDSLLTLRLQESLYSEDNARHLLQSYVNLLTEFSMTPEMSLQDVRLWREADIDKAVALGKGPTMNLQWAPTLSHRVDEMIEKYGLNLAIQDGLGTAWTYSQMAARVNAIFASLIAHKVAEGARVAVFQEPTADWVCSLLAIFRVGAVYVPLDLRTSLPRLANIVGQCKPGIILAHNLTIASIPALKATSARVINISTIPRFNHRLLQNRAHPSSPALLLFTSGSTGTPKGIIVNHASLRNQMEGYSREWKIAQGAMKVLQQSAFSFDFSVDQIFSALANGGSLYIVPSKQRGDPLEITKLMADEGITYTSATPSEYLLWTNFGAANLTRCSKWKYAFAGGELLTETLVKDIASLGLTGLHFFNNYGPAEITIASTKMEVPYNAMAAGELAPAGFMLPNYSVYILDQNLRPLPVGFPGEIVIGGAGVSSGYLENEALTEGKFVPDLFASSDFKANGWNTMYRTGDRGRLREDGALICEGRIDGDTQVKMHGIRIELGDVESCILQAADGALTDAVVSVRNENDAQFLVAHVVFSPHYLGQDREEFLKRLPSSLALPQSMCPAMVIPLDRLPLTNHLKIDRRAIGTMSLPAVWNDVATDDLTPTEFQLQTIWRDILPHAPLIAAETEFFSVGGNSLLLVKLQAMIRNAFSVLVPLMDLVTCGELKQMALIVDDATKIRTIDWKVETELPKDLSESIGEQQSAGSKSMRESNKLAVLLTGSTGYLGRHLLPRLVAHPRVSKIYCVAVRDKTKIPLTSEKVVMKAGDLQSHRFGLAEEEYNAMAQEVDIIVHAGANRSFWDDYKTLKATNVTPIRQLIGWAHPRKTPIHFVSSGGVFEYGSYPPPTDGSDGYVATKWAADKLLANAATHLGLPAYIHRPLAMNQSSAPTPPQVLSELSALARRMQTRPSFDGVGGSIDLIPIDAVTERMCAAFFAEESTGSSLHEITYQSRMRVDLGAFVDHLQRDQELKGLPEISALEWVGQAKLNGFSYFIASQDIAMSRGENQEARLVSRR